VEITAIPTRQKLWQKRAKNCETSHRIKFVDSECDLLGSKLANLSWEKAKISAANAPATAVSKWQNKAIG